MTNQEDFIAKWTNDTKLLASFIVAPIPACHYCAYYDTDKCENFCGRLICLDGVAEWLQQEKE